MTVEEIIAYGAEYGTTLTKQQIYNFYGNHKGCPTALDLAIFVGAMDKDGNMLPKKEANEK